MSKSIQLKNINNEKIYPHPYYPVGSIYLSVNDTNPSQWFGGKWEQIAKGRTLVGVDTSDTDFNTVKKTGGSKYLQKHYHDIRYGGPTGNGVTISCTGAGLDVLNVNEWAWSKNNPGYKDSGSNLCTNYEGTGNSGNLQPYFTCYIWCRTA